MTGQGVSKPDDNLTLVRETMARLWKGKWWVLCSVVLFTSLFVVAALRMTPIYRTSTVLVPASADGDAGGLGATMRSFADTASLLGLSLGGGGRGNPEEALAVLRSREFLEKFILEKDLIPVLFQKEWDTQRKQWKQPDAPPTPARAYKYFSRHVLVVSEDRKTSLVSVSIEWRDREQSAAWANELVERLNGEMRSRALKESSDSVVFLEAELRKTSLVGMQGAISRIIEAQINKQMLANVTQEYALRVVERAMAPDEGDVVRPDKKLLAGLGLFLGGLFGVAAVLLIGIVRRA